MPKAPSSAETAVGPMVIAALERLVPASQRLLSDDIAIHMLPPASARIVALCRWQPLRRLLVWLSEAAAPGAWGGMLGRKRYLEDLTRRCLSEFGTPIVVLGAGLDTKAAALAVPAGIPAYEVDQADNIVLKRVGLVRAFGDVPEGLRLVTVDFEHADLEAELASAGLDLQRPALYLWEGVTQYLSEASVRQTMSFLSKAAPGSRLAFTFVLADFIAGTNMYGSEAIHRRLVDGYKVWHFGLEPQRVPEFLATYGWRQVEQVGSEYYEQNYFAPLHREMPVMRIERVVLAEKI